MKKHYFSKRITKVLAIAFVLALACMATGCTNDKNNNNSGSMVESNNQGSSNALDNNNSQNTSVGDNNLNGGNYNNSVTEGNNGTNNDSLLNDAGNAVGDVVDDVGNGLRDLTDDLTEDSPGTGVAPTHNGTTRNQPAANNTGTMSGGQTGTMQNGF